jgi:hypothetical protein
MQNIYHNLHDTATTISKLIQTVDFNNAFVGQWAIFAVEWLPEEMNFYINGQISKSVKFAEESTGLTDWSKNDFTCINFLNQTDQRIQISLSLDTLVYNNPDLSESFEVEYVRSYKLKKGNDDEYWPLNFSMADTNMFKVHKSIRLGWDGHTAIIPIGHNITLWAREGIVLDKGFVVTANTTFVARNIKTTNLFEY